ncbi:hypothetical protein GC170_18915 [bacterium]|nr:hypothetical protein [bacterium]
MIFRINRIRIRRKITILDDRRCVIPGNQLCQIGVLQGMFPEFRQKLIPIISAKRFYLIVCKGFAFQLSEGRGKLFCCVLDRDEFAVDRDVIQYDPEITFHMISLGIPCEASWLLMVSTRMALPPSYASNAEAVAIVMPIKNAPIANFDRNEFVSLICSSRLRTISQTWQGKSRRSGLRNQSDSISQAAISQ